MGNNHMAQRYTASKSPTKDGTGWVISFRHPLRKDPRGKHGLKVRRGLGTSNESQAQALTDEMNILLGDTSWHTIARRAEAERRFNPAIVRAFFDDIEAQPSNSINIRNRTLPLPTAADGYAQVMLVGTTGAGKTSLLRHMIGSHPDSDRFPSTSASRTTISDIEVITADEPAYRAVVALGPAAAVEAHDTHLDAVAVQHRTHLLLGEVDVGLSILADHEAVTVAVALHGALDLGHQFGADRGGAGVLVRFDDIVQDFLKCPGGGIGRRTSFRY